MNKSQDSQKDFKTYLEVKKSKLNSSSELLNKNGSPSLALESHQQKDKSQRKQQSYLQKMSTMQLA